MLDSFSLQCLSPTQQYLFVCTCHYLSQIHIHYKIWIFHSVFQWSWMRIFILLLSNTLAKLVCLHCIACFKLKDNSFHAWTHKVVGFYGLRWHLLFFCFSYRLFAHISGEICMEMLKIVGGGGYVYQLHCWLFFCLCYLLFVYQWLSDNIILSMHRYSANTSGSTTSMVTPCGNLWNSSELSEISYCPRTTKEAS